MKLDLRCRGLKLFCPCRPLADYVPVSPVAPSRTSLEVNQARKSLSERAIDPGRA